MAISLEFKANLISKLHDLLDDKINLSKINIEKAKESRDSDTKSSMGDKYETSRAMIHIEIGKAETQVSQSHLLKKQLSMISPDKSLNTVQFGSLVETSEGIYFISIGLGLVEFEGNNIFCISMAAPLGKALKDKNVGDSVSFNGKVFELREVC